MTRRTFSLPIRVYFRGGTNPSWNSLTFDYRIEPKFEEREAELSMIRKATCHISVEMPSGTGSSAEVGYGSATAFFIGPATLLTAGHVLKPGQMGRAQLPGKAKVERDSGGVFTKKIKVSAFDVKAVACFLVRNSPGRVDLSVLETVGFTHADWVALDLEGNLNVDDVIDVVGYPGTISEDRLLISHHLITNANLDQALQNAKLLLPSGTLAVTTGVITSTGEMPTFRASTTHGMSGAPVVRKGKVIGIERKRTCLMYRVAQRLEHKRRESLYSTGHCHEISEATFNI
jgi:V8-like Glu-specific endopeptidase